MIPSSENPRFLAFYLWCSELPHGSLSVTSFLSVLSMTFPKYVSKCPPFSIFTRPSPAQSAVTFHYNSSYCLLDVDGAKQFQMVQRMYLLQESECIIGRRSQRRIFLAPVFSQSFTHRSWRFREHKAVPQPPGHSALRTSAELRALRSRPLCSLHLSWAPPLSAGNPEFSYGCSPPEGSPGNSVNHTNLGFINSLSWGAAPAGQYLSHASTGQVKGSTYGVCGL